MTRVVIRVWAIPKNLNPVTVTEAPVVPVVKVARDDAADATKPVAWKRRSGKKTPGHPHRRVASQMAKAETGSETAITVTVTELAIVGAKTKTVTNDGTPQNTKHDVRHETVEHEALKRAPLPRTDAPPFVAVL